MSREEFVDLFVDELKDIYSAETQIVQALPNVINAVSSPDLKKVFETHLSESKQQITRLDRIFKILDQSPRGETSVAMQGLLEKGTEVINRYPKSPTRDAGLIAAAQRVEHYEIASYGTLKTFAKELDLTEIADLLQESLDQEGSTNKKLTKVAEGGLFVSGINQKAKAGHR